MRKAYKVRSCPNNILIKYGLENILVFEKVVKDFFFFGILDLRKHILSALLKKSVTVIEYWENRTYSSLISIYKGLLFVLLIVIEISTASFKFLPPLPPPPPAPPFG